uniref:Uncharacterized protein n=1 Tax=Manihot esculenta TaxID=3983 RepID=A0A2C9V2V9_MANES
MPVIGVISHQLKLDVRWDLVDKAASNTRHLWIPSLRLSGRCIITCLLSQKQHSALRKQVAIRLSLSHCCSVRKQKQCASSQQKQQMQL